MAAIKRGQKRKKGNVRRGVAEMLEDSRRGQRFHAPKMLPPIVQAVIPRVVVPDKISYQKARSRFLENLCPVCESFLTESIACSRCGRSWGLDDLKAAFARS